MTRLCLLLNERCSVGVVLKLCSPDLLFDRVLMIGTFGWALVQWTRGAPHKSTGIGTWWQTVVGENWVMYRSAPENERPRFTSTSVRCYDTETVETPQTE